MENVKYKKINDFINTLTPKEKKFLYKKLKKELFENDFLQVNFTINGEKVAI